jgi:hypothetical protein
MSILESQAEIEVVHNTMNESSEITAKELNADLEIAKEEQESPENDPRTSKELVAEQEKINEEITLLEKQKKEQILKVTLFVESVTVIISDLKGHPALQYEKIKKAGLLDALPKDISSLIEENYTKFNFIDWKATEVMLGNNAIDTKLESLIQQREVNEFTISKFENKSTSSEESMEENELEIGLAESLEVTEDKKESLEDVVDITSDAEKLNRSIDLDTAA